MSIEWDFSFLDFYVANYDSISHNARWRHGVETLSVLLAFCERNPSVPGRFPSQSDSYSGLQFFGEADMLL